MTIISITYIAGGSKSGKSTVARSLAVARIPSTSSSIFCIFDENFTKKEAIEALNAIKVNAAYYHIILIGEMIYQLIDYEFGNVPKYEISCKAS